MKKFNDKIEQLEKKRFFSGETQISQTKIFLLIICSIVIILMINKTLNYFSQSEKKGNTVQFLAKSESLSSPEQQNKTPFLETNVKNAKTKFSGCNGNCAACGLCCNL